MDRAIVFDVGGTYLRSTMLLADGSTGCTVKQRLKSHIDGSTSAAIWRNLVEDVVGFIRHSAYDTPVSVPIVMSFPGPVTSDGCVLSAPSLTGSVGCPYELGAELNRLTGRPVRLLNDLSAAAWHVSKQTNAMRFMVVTVSSGIGSKIIDRARTHAVLDDVPHSGEIGHLVVDDSADAPVCDCGAPGHLGAIASGRGIERAARRSAARDPVAFSRSLCARDLGVSAECLTNEDHLIPAAMQGDAWSLDVVRSCTLPLARALCSVFMGAGLDEIAVIGGFAQALGERYACILGEEFARIATYGLLGDEQANRIWLAEAGEETCLLGAAEYAVRLPGDQR